MARGAKRAAGVSHALIQLFKRLKLGLLEVLVVSQRQGGSWLLLPWVTLALTLWQMVSFVTDSTLGAPWPPAVSPIELGGSFTNARAYTSIFPPGSFAAGAFYASIAWVVLLLALLAYGMYHFALDKVMPWTTPLKVLRDMAKLSVGVLTIPLLQVLLAPLGAPEASTWGAVKGAVGAILAVALMLLALLFAGVYYDPVSVSRNPSASAHGRVQIIMLGVKLVATVVGGRIIPGLSVTFVASALLVCGLAWLGA
jgi:hypothetical protein